MSTDSTSTSEAVPPGLAFRVATLAAADDPAELAAVLVEKLRLHPTDAQIRVRMLPGLLPDRLGETAARDLAETITGLGVMAEALPEGEVPDFEFAEVVHHARCLPEGLQIIEFHGQPESLVPWSDFQLMSIGWVEGLETEWRIPRDQYVVVGSAPKLTQPVVPVRGKSGPEMWLVRANPRRGFRIDHQQMNYEYLGARMVHSATANFRKFVDDIIHVAPQLYLTPATRAFLQTGPLNHYEFASSEDLRRYTVFHLLLRDRLAERMKVEA